MAAFLSDPAVNATMTATLELLNKNTGYDDIAALALLALGGFGYLSRGRLWDKPDPFHYKWFERPQEQNGAISAAKKETRNIAQKLEETNRDLVIFWGSQSGTAEGFAHRLARDCHRRFKLDAVVADLSDYDTETIALIPESKFAIFILSTYGEGDPSDNATDFLHWLKTNAESTWKNLRYAAFGLGNSNYKYYNKVIDVVVAALESFGSSALLPVAKANEATGTTEEDFLEWKESLFAMFRNTLSLAEHEPEYEATIKVVEDESMVPIDLHLGEPVPQRTIKKAAAAISPVGALPIREIRELTSNSSASRSCVHLELDLSATPEIKYKTGDHLAVWPVNPTEEVSRLLNVLNLEAKKEIPITILPLDPQNNKLKIPTPTTIQALFQHYLEICAPVSRETVAALAQFAPSETIKSTLVSLATKEAYATFLLSNHVTLSRLLEYTISQDPSVNWSQVPISFVIESLQAMSPRYYSISSSSITHPRHASITVAVAPAPIAQNPSITIPGLASTYISNFSSKSESLSQPLYPPVAATPSLHAHMRRSTFKLPASYTAPIIMVAAGTGIAPFRAFLHERARFASMGREIGPMLLVFGCRTPEQDYLYREEIEELQNGPLKGSLQIINAYSRVSGQEKVYVQQRVAEKADDICRMLLDEDASFFICGAAAMSREVGKAVNESVKKRKDWDDEAVAKWREERKRVRRWQEDVWG